MFLTLCVYYVHVCLLKVVWITLHPCTRLLGGRPWPGVGAVRHVRLWWGGLCAAGACCEAGGSAGVPARLPAKAMEERENCRRREALCPSSFALGRSSPFPGRVAMLSSLCWAADPWGGRHLSGTEQHEPHVVGSAKYVCVYGVGGCFAQTLLEHFGFVS